MKFKIENSKLKITTEKQGFSVVEALLAGAVFALIGTAVLGSLAYGEESSALAGYRSRAAAFAEEGLEAARNIRDNSFSNLSDGSHGLAVTGGEWVFSGTSDAADGFTREVVISTVDADRKSAVSTVTWQQNPQRTGSLSLTSRLTNWLRTVGGWVSLFQQSSLNLAGTNDSTKIQSQGNYVYVVRNDGTPDFLVIDVSNPASPSIAGSLSLADIPTNIAVSGNYAYVSSRDNSQELKIIDISTPVLPVQVGSFNATGSADALGVYASGSTAYLVRATSSAAEFMIINATVPAVPTLTGSLELSDSGNEVFVSGSSAFFASAHDSQELQVINITIPSSPSLAGLYDISANSDALTVAGFGSTVLLGHTASLFLFNVSTPSSPVVLGSYGAAGTINDIALNLGSSNSFVYLVTANSSKEFEVVDISVPSTPATVGSLNLTGLNGVAYSVSLDRAFAVGESDTEEFIVLSPL